MSDPVHPRSGGPNGPIDDLARALPDPPPPRPARRAEAIASALERFDRGGTEPLAARAKPAPRSRVWWRTGRARVAALASAALVALVAVPLALEHPNGGIDPPSMPPPPTVDVRSGSVSSPKTPPTNGAKPSSGSRSSEDLKPAAVAAGSRPSGPGAAAPPLPPSEVAAAPVAESFAPPPPPAAPAPPAPVVARALGDTAGFARRASSAAADTANIVVTGSRLSRQAKAASRRGDWNACTVADPEQNLRGCERLVGSGGRGAAGAAGAQIAEGLALGWHDDWNGAIEAFDRALASRPRLGIAYLNRGLAHERLGAADKALADFAQAVRFDPSARSYYARSRARRARGDIRGARADENRAVDLDPDYASVVSDQLP